MKKLLIVFCMTVAVGLAYALPPRWRTHKFTIEDKTVSISMPDTVRAGCFFHPVSWKINMAFFAKNAEIMTDIISNDYDGMASIINDDDSLSTDSIIIVKKYGDFQFYKEIRDSVWLIGLGFNGDRTLLDSIFRTVTVEDTTGNNYPMTQYRPFKVRIIDNDSVKKFALSPIYDDSLKMRYLWSE